MPTNFTIILKIVKKIGNLSFQLQHNMKHKLLLFWLFQLFWFFSIQAQTKKFKIHTVAFYNFENLFDTINDPDTFDEEWTPEGTQRWTSAKYQTKLSHLAQVLSEIGTAENKEMPTFIGGCEIENRTVLEDLIRQSQLQEAEYGIIHFDSPDKRGIDVALLYRKKWFKPTSFSAIPLYITKNVLTEKTNVATQLIEKTEDDISVMTTSKRIYTRDQLLVSGFLEGEEIHIIVNHWPSRSGGEKKSSPYREAAGKQNKKMIDSLQQLNSNAKIITMGDLNDGPENKSIKVALGTKAIRTAVASHEIYNPFESLLHKGLGTIAHQDAWDIFDQIMLTGTWLTADYSTWQYWKAGIYSPNYLIQNQGKYKGYPLRHSLTEVGYSDHFPVYVYLIREGK